MKGILYIGHGTRSKKGAEEVRAFINNIMSQINVPIQELCFLELTSPSIEEGFQRCVERGATIITIVPLFLLAAGHIKEDIPLALSGLKEKYPHIQIEVKDPFGVQEQILDGVSELIKNEAHSLTELDSVLIVGRGSSDPAIQHAFKEIAVGIGERINSKQITVCYLAASEPAFADSLESVSQHTPGRVIVVPYLLFPGLLLSEIDKSVRLRQKKGQSISHTGPLCKHQIIEEIVTRRATEEDIPL
ncbi:sirohydrochlorin chelatase [Bacillus sp. BRMEA1]|uniref:sirohydrochlorin chelatase n=1 Tax=Neobacillus endophyticus TaxID=2738405 RepID=UPI001566E859|nr:sirohydrochlorin chelatase [Neobacillus endophyticus]NRD79228.1 sirohydrochlorin chelatase [Neobacillus endophyticus]